MNVVRKLFLVLLAIAMAVSTGFVGMTPASAQSPDWEDLVDGVAEVVSPGAPGPVWAEDPAWVPIVSGDDDTSFPSTFVMARTYYSGRVVIMGHDGLIGNIHLLDNQQFMLNIISWLDASDGKTVMYSSGHGEWVTSGTLAPLRTELESRGYTVEEAAAPIDSAFLATRDVLIFGNAWDTIGESEIGAIESFVNNGGGLLLIGLGWSWLGYHPGSTMDDYPMVKLAAPYGARWLRHYIVDPTNQDATSSAIFHVFYPDVEEPNLYQAFESIRQITDSHLHDLPQALEIDPSLQREYVLAHMTVSIPTFIEFPMSHPQRQEVYDFCKEIAVLYPDYYTKPPSFDPGVHPTMANIRERFFRTWIDSVEFDSTTRSEIATLGAFFGRYLDIWNQFGVYLMDNTSLDSAQQQFLFDLLSLIPLELHDLRAISVRDFLGTPPQPLDINGPSSAVNIFGVRMGVHIENSFPGDVAPGYIDVFCAAAAHEVNHVVDAFTIGNDPALSQRRDDLIAAAGDDHMNYLRSMLPDGFFTTYPQEFFASIANQWFTDSAKTIELGLVRFDAGYSHPINQALFFAEVYSRGSNPTYFYNTDTEGHILRTEVPLARDTEGRIFALRYQGTIYEFTLDTAGDVTGYTVYSVAEPEVWVDDDWTGSSPGDPVDGHIFGIDAFAKIQDGIDAVAPTCTVHVLAGTYYENIILKDGVQLLGAGAEVATIDGGGAGSVVTAIGVGPDTVLDGFTITNGSAVDGGGMYMEDSSPGINSNTFESNSATGMWPAGRGGGIYMAYSSPMVTNCTFSDNSATNAGGGMYNAHSSPTVIDCTFSSNSAEYGGGMCNDYSPSPVVTNCTFSGNSAAVGGGMRNYLSSPMVTNCTFSDNSATNAGGGMYNDYSSPTVIDCTFSSNSAEYGGGMCNDYSSSPVVTNCTFSGNSAAVGGGMRNYSSSPTVTNCRFSSNSATYGGGMLNEWYSSPTVANCTFSGNSATDNGGGMRNYSSSPTVTNCIFSGNSATWAGGGMHNEWDSSPTVTNCTFDNNSATVAGGGMLNDNCSPTVTDCIFSGNSANWGGGMNNIGSSPAVTNCRFSSNSATWGGGMLTADSSPPVTNCIFSDNSATWGGGMYNRFDSSPTVTSCTFSGNSATYGGGMYNEGSSPTVTNCILWGNGEEIANDATSTPLVTYCDIQGDYPGEGNIDADPLFVDPAGGDYRLQAGSPCIDVGSNAAVPGWLTTDFEGDPRTMDGDGDGEAIVDMGADERWTYMFQDPRRGTSLYISTGSDIFFRFTAPDYDSGIVLAEHMIVRDTRGGQFIRISHSDSEIILFVFAMDGRRDFCQARVMDLETEQMYRLLDRPGIE